MVGAVSRDGCVSVAHLRGVRVHHKRQARGNEYGRGADSAHGLHGGVPAAREAVEVSSTSVGALPAGERRRFGCGLEPRVFATAADHSVGLANLQPQATNVITGANVLSTRRCDHAGCVPPTPSVVHAASSVHIFDCFRASS